MTEIERLQTAGIKRAGTPKAGFRYVGAPRGELDRVRSLGIPPAWKDVAIARSARARLQAVGRDVKGRWQYRYSPQAIRERELRKYDRLLQFGNALPGLRRVIDRDLKLAGLPREKVMACILRILSTCFMRPGSQVYAKENGSFGIATLQNRHVSVRGSAVHFDYMGKSKQRQVRELRDGRVARIVRELKALPGKDLFQYVAEDGSVVNIRRRHINEYIREVMGGRFSAKDFRTWAGTMICASALARLNAEVVEGRTDRRRMVTVAIKETAAQLGNTPAVCRTSYIWPSVVTSFEKGAVVGCYFARPDELVVAGGKRRRDFEAALLALLRTGRDAVPAALAKKPRAATVRKLNRRLRTPRMKALAKAFLH
jgi:DNA topoisomerase-1